MATMTIQITAGANTYGSAKTISTGDLNRLIAAYEQLFNTVGNNQATGNAWANQLFKETKETVHRYEKHKAALDAATPIEEIVIS